MNNCFEPNPVLLAVSGLEKHRFYLPAVPVFLGLLRAPDRQGPVTGFAYHRHGGGRSWASPRAFGPPLLVLSGATLSQIRL